MTTQVDAFLVFGREKVSTNERRALGGAGVAHKKLPPPQDLTVAMCMGLHGGPRGWAFLMSEEPRNRRSWRRWSRWRATLKSGAVHPAPCTLHPTPYTLHHTPYTIHHTPYTTHSAPYTLHPTPYTLHSKPTQNRRSWRRWSRWRATPKSGASASRAKTIPSRPSSLNRRLRCSPYYIYIYIYGCTYIYIYIYIYKIKIKIHMGARERRSQGPPRPAAVSGAFALNPATYSLYYTIFDPIQSSLVRVFSLGGGVSNQQLS